MALVYGNIFPFKILRLKYIVIGFHCFVLFLILEAINIGDIRRGILKNYYHDLHSNVFKGSIFVLKINRYIYVLIIF